MHSLTISQWAIMALAALIIGISKTGFPGIGILAIPLAALVVPAKESTGLILPMLIVGDIMAVAFYRRHAIWMYLLKLFPCAIIGVAIGVQLLKIITNEQLKPFIGIVILTLLILNWWRNQRLAKSGELHVPQGWWFPITMGILAGIITMMANAAGPIVVIYLLAMRLPKSAFMGTGAWYFLLLNTYKIPFSWHLGLITPASLLFDLEIAPVIILGGLAGFYLLKHIPEKPFTWTMQLLAAAAALQLILSIIPW